MGRTSAAVRADSYRIRQRWSRKRFSSGSCRSRSLQAHPRAIRGESAAEHLQVAAFYAQASTDSIRRILLTQRPAGKMPIPHFVRDDKPERLGARLKGG